MSNVLLFSKSLQKLIKLLFTIKAHCVISGLKYEINKKKGIISKQL